MKAHQKKKNAYPTSTIYVLFNKISSTVYDFCSCTFFETYCINNMMHIFVKQIFTCMCQCRLQSLQKIYKIFLIKRKFYFLVYFRLATNVHSNSFNFLSWDWRKFHRLPWNNDSQILSPILRSTIEHPRELETRSEHY